MTLINLRRARKARARALEEAKSAENRARFGASKAERTQNAANESLDRRRLDGQRRDPEVPDE